MKFIELEKQNSKYMVRLNRPEKRNAFSAEMIDEITSTFKKISADSEVSTVVITGNGKSFCAGADLEWMKSMVNYSLDENVEDSNKLFDMFSSIYNCPHPVISMAQGHVMGGATGILACSDIAIATEDTQFAFSEVKLGLAPAVISPFVMRRISSKGAHRYFLTGERFKANEALHIGLIDRVGEEEALAECLKQIDGNGLEAMRETKKLLRNYEGPIDGHKVFVTKIIAERRVSEEGQQRLRGFLEG